MSQASIIDYQPREAGHIIQGSNVVTDGPHPSHSSSTCEYVTSTYYKHLLFLRLSDIRLGSHIIQYKKPTFRCFSIPHWLPHGPLITSIEQVVIV
uniref:Putative ovule protein n=1 Tax=Solanum chacoense TaxID=4108 RepID=A0A0V0HHK3_SOLCH